MAFILNIETATTVCSVALSDNEKLVAVREVNAGYTHAENITVFIDEVLKEAGLGPSDLDAVAVSRGPGSYTGLRIGVSAAKGLCYALDIPLIAVDTLAAMAQGMKSAKDVLLCPMIDARRMEVYCAVYDGSGREREPVSAKIIDESSFAGILEKNRVIFFGDGAAKCKAVLGKNSHAVFVDDIHPSSKHMIPLAWEKFSEKEFADLAYFEPFYLKEFIAGKKGPL